MFIDYLDYEKKEFLSQSQTYFIPGYTGHCPTLKFQFGKCYGACTKDIIQTLRRNGIFHGSSTTVVSSIGKQADTRKVHPSQRKYILGYTGYIPGMYQHHGQSFCHIAEQCETKRSQRKVSFEKKLHSSHHTCGDLSMRPYSMKSARTRMLAVN